MSADDFFDYYEVVMCFCTVKDCEWTLEAQWSEMGDDDPEGAPAKHRAHFAATHPELMET